MNMHDGVMRNPLWSGGQRPRNLQFSHPGLNRQLNPRMRLAVRYQRFERGRARIFADQRLAVEREIDRLEQGGLARLVMPFDQDTALPGKPQVDVAQMFERLNAQ